MTDSLFFPAASIRVSRSAKTDADGGAGRLYGRRRGQLVRHSVSWPRQPRTARSTTWKRWSRLIACCPSIPGFKVTNLANGKSVNVRVIDRGPFVDGRIIDLSKAAARQIDLLGPGIGRVRLEVIAAPADIPANDFYAVQVGAFSVRENAERVREHYAERFGTAQLAVKQGPTPVWRVLVGKVSSIAAAQQLANRTSGRGKNVFVVRLDQTAADSTLPPSSRTLRFSSINETQTRVFPGPDTTSRGDPALRKRSRDTATSSGHIAAFDADRQLTGDEASSPVGYPNG